MFAPTKGVDGSTSLGRCFLLLPKFVKHGVVKFKSTLGKFFKQQSCDR